MTFLRGWLKALQVTRVVDQTLTITERLDTRWSKS